MSDGRRTVLAILGVVILAILGVVAMCSSDDSEPSRPAPTAASGLITDVPECGDGDNRANLRGLDRRGNAWEVQSVCVGVGERAMRDLAEAALPAIPQGWVRALVRTDDPTIWRVCRVDRKATSEDRESVASVPAESVVCDAE